MKATVSLLSLLLLASAAPPPPGGGSAKALAMIVDEYSQHQIDSSPAERLQRGLPVHDLPELTEESVAKEAAFARALLDRLSRIDPESLEGEDWFTHGVLKWDLEMTVEGARHSGLSFSVVPYALPLVYFHDVFARHPLESKEDLERYLRLLRQYPARVGQLRATLDGQRGRGILMPKGEIDLAVPMLRGFALPPERGVFAVAPERLAKIGSGPDKPGADAFRAEVARIVAAEINPALEGFAAYLAGDYRRAAPERTGIGQYPGGEEAYRYLVRQHTTLDITPEELHRRGLEEMERLRGRMAEIRRQLGFQGTQREFHQKLKTDPRFLARTPDEVAERLMAPVRRIEPKIKDYFLRVPRAPYGVRRLDPALEGSVTFGTYRQPNRQEPTGYYLFNASQLDQRPLTEAASLIYHELVPGHHFQIALQQENEDLPAFRRPLFVTAFVEGWAEYASELAREMGLYDDPYDDYGRLGADMFLTSRLVVDPGMNLLGWPRSKAMDLMRENLLISDVQIDTETLRYSAAIPGQALAYKTGSFKIWELRRRAEKALGSRFDIRRFHDAVLSHGALPLAVLERHIDRWIAQERHR